MSRYGIDVSEYQGNIRWQEVRRSGAEFAILRSVKRNLTPDKRFEENYRGCREQGLLAGVYKYSYAMTEKEARQEAWAVLELLAGRRLELPVFMDVEEPGHRALPKAELTALIRAFLKTIIDGGYPAAIYCNLDWYRHVLETEAFRDTSFWIASYGPNNGQAVKKFQPEVGEICWQYTSRGSVPGIQGNVDLNLLYEDYGDGAAANGPVKPFRVQVSIDDLIIRTGPGIGYPRAGGYTGVGVFTIVAVAAGPGSAAGWGQLKSGAGWISLDYCRRLDS